MTRREELQKLRDELLESIRLDWADMAEPGRSAAERQGIRAHILWAIEELVRLVDELETLDD